MPSEIVKAVNKVKIAETEYKESIKDHANFKKNHKEIFKQRSKLSSTRWRKRQVLVKKKWELSQYDPLTCINLFTH